MNRHGTHQRRALLVGSELSTRQTMARYLHLHGMDVVEAETIPEASRYLSDEAGFDLLIAPMQMPDHPEWAEWKSLITRKADLPVLVHGLHPDVWTVVSKSLNRSAGFIENPFTLSDFHWALHELLESTETGP